MISMAKNWSPFKVNNDITNTNTNTNTRMASMESKAVGLKILTTSSSSRTQSHSILIFHWNQIPSSYNHPCFLKSCFLCHKHLSPNKDVYMYRGNQGFCSEECRSRQIYIDDVRQLEISTKKMMQQFRHQSRGRRCDDHHLRHRHKSMASPIFS